MLFCRVTKALQGSQHKNQERLSSVASLGQERLCYLPRLLLTMGEQMELHPNHPRASCCSIQPTHMDVHMTHTHTHCHTVIHQESAGCIAANTQFSNGSNLIVTTTSCHMIQGICKLEGFENRAANTS
eukprot:5244441-Amphidinium_carterae.1